MYTSAFAGHTEIEWRRIKFDVSYMRASYTCDMHKTWLKPLLLMQSIHDASEQQRLANRIQEIEKKVQLQENTAATTVHKIVSKKHIACRKTFKTCMQTSPCPDESYIGHMIWFIFFKWHW